MSATDDFLNSTCLLIVTDDDVGVDQPDKHTEQSAWTNVGHQNGISELSKASGSADLVLNSLKHLGLQLAGGDFDISFSGALTSADDETLTVTWTATGVVNNNAGSAGFISGPFGDTGLYSLTASGVQGSISAIVSSNDLPIGLPCVDGGAQASQLATLTRPAALGSLTIQISAQRTNAPFFNPGGSIFPDTDDFQIDLDNIAIDGRAGVPIPLAVTITPEARPWFETYGKNPRFQANVTGVPSGRTPTFQWSLPFADGQATIVGAANERVCEIDMGAVTVVFIECRASLLGVEPLAYLSYVTPPRRIGKAMAAFQKAATQAHVPPPDRFPRRPYRPGDPPPAPGPMSPEALHALRGLYSSIAKAAVHVVAEIDAAAESRET